MQVSISLPMRMVNQINRQAIYRNIYISAMVSIKSTKKYLFRLASTLVLRYK